MKKRLLITSIVMMLVVAVALSTATYAWFTSNTTVNATSMTLKAGVSDAAALGIGWKGGLAGTEIDSNLTDTLKPMAPVSLVNGTTQSTVVFGSASTKQVNSVIAFNGDYNTTDAAQNPLGSPIIYNNGGSGDNNVAEFYLTNLSNANTVDFVTLTAVFDKVVTQDTVFEANKTYYTKSGEQYSEAQVTVGDPVNGTYYEDTANDMIRVAIFTKDYRITVDATALDGKTYYEYNNTNDSFNAKTGLTVGSSSVEGLYEISSTYDLIGVLGNAQTTFTKATTWDRNTTYYSVEATQVTNPVVADMTKYFEPSTNTYTRTSDTQPVSGKTYYTLEVTQLDLNDNVDVTNYYTAINTAVYGAGTLFEVNDKVRDLQHYTNVGTNLVFTTAFLPKETVEIVAIAWLDGTILDDARAGDIGKVSLKFDSGKLSNN